MNKINYEQHIDNFKKYEDVASELLWGDREYIPNPLFTILIPTYKRVDLLKEALFSALGQWHVPFYWNVLVLDNEEYLDEPNETEKFIREVNNPRVLYYRNKEHLLPGDNFNRGFTLANGKWIMMLHDDDILIDNALQKMSALIDFLHSKKQYKIGAISTSCYRFKYDPTDPQSSISEIQRARNEYLNTPLSYNLRIITHNNVLFDTHIGGSVPTNGTTFNREVILKVGGFNTDYGISSDMILYYCMENNYQLYYSHDIFGFYRWGTNTMVKKESTMETIQCGYDFRNYAYSKSILSKIWGKIFCKSQHRFYTIFVLEQNRQITGKLTDITEFDQICDTHPNKHVYALYMMVIRPLYEHHKSKQIATLKRK